jgi:aurora kinase, other
MDTWKIEDFCVGRSLGEGAVGHVYHAVHIATNKDFALKIIPKVMIKKQVHMNVKREIEIQARLQHKNILRLYGYFQDPSCLYIVLEYMNNGDLYSYIKQNTPVPIPVAKSIMMCIASGLKYMNRYKVIHRDLKPENILLDKDLNAKIADFGLCALKPFKEKRYSQVGTLQFMPPEMAEMKGCDCSSDLWNLGLILYEMLCGCQPIEITSLNHILTLTTLQPSDDWDETTKDLYQRLVSKQNRLSITELIAHKWFIT